MKSTTRQLILLLIIISSNYTLSFTQNLVVSGITNPVAANGVYEPNGTLYGYDSWKHESQNYYLYNDDYGGRYWNIDTDTDDEGAGVLFYSSSTSTAASPINANIPLWDEMNGSGTPSIVEQVAATAPTVTTTSASSITTTSATLGGNVTSDGGATVTERGVVYSTTDATPTIAEGATKDANGSGTGTFSESIGSLNANITYYFNTYAINSEGTSYGTADSFTTLPQVATVTTQAVTSITTTTATGNGNVTDLGDPNPTQHGVCWNTGGTPTTADSKTEDGAVSATGAFTSDITGLSPNTTYYVRAYATNTAGTSYSNEVSFMTSEASNTSDIESQNLYTLYPNPAKDFIIIEINRGLQKENMTCTIMNLTGSALINKTVSSSKLCIDVSKLTAGFYIVELKSNNMKIRKNLILN